MVDSEFGNSAIFKALESIKDEIVFEDVQDFEKVDYQNNAYNITSILGYLIGVYEEEFEKEENPAMMMSVYKKLEQNKNARIIRNLCFIRTAMEKYYMPIAMALKSSLTNINSIPEYIPTKVISQLSTDGISLTKSHHNIDLYITALIKQWLESTENRWFPEGARVFYFKFTSVNGRR